MPKRRTPEDRYKEMIRRQKKTLEEFAEHEYEWANDLFLWHRLKKLEVPDDIYRAAAFFTNREYLRKPGSLTLLYQMDIRCHRELPECTRENAFDLLCFKYKMYAEVLKTGGYD